MSLTDASGRGRLNVDLIRSVEAFLYQEARLLDGGMFDEWYDLFADDGIYWIPINPERDPSEAASVIFDSPRRRHERVHHLVRIPFPAQSPPSRSLHLVSNVEILAEEDDEVAVASSQCIYEMRTGDFRQVGLGEVRVFPGRVDYRLKIVEDSFRILMKKLVFLNRDIALSNMTTIY